VAKSARLQKFLEMREKNLAAMPTLGAQLDAMVREGAKDLRQTIADAYSGKGEHAPEVGAPGNPTQAMTTADLMQTGIYGRGKDAEKAKEDHELEMG
jgi:hypothetical protein